MYEAKRSRNCRFPLTDPVRRARSISSVEQAAALYAEWASTYDADVFGELGFTGSARIAELLVSVLPDPTLPVIDLGCGTGAVGQRLAQLGVTTVDGVDLSPEMLAVAANTGAYRRSHRGRSARARSSARLALRGVGRAQGRSPPATSDRRSCRDCSISFVLTASSPG